jgi:hypothetical protein
VFILSPARHSSLREKIRTIGAPRPVGGGYVAPQQARTPIAMELDATQVTPLVTAAAGHGHFAATTRYLGGSLDIGKT